MKSILTVTAPSDTYDLTTSEAVLRELGVAIEPSTVRAWIHQASGAVANYCNRVFAQEGLQEQFRLAHHEERRRAAQLILRRIPVAAVTAVVENGATLDPSGYELDAARGLLARLSNDRPCHWACGKITVAYTAGYELLAGLPWEVERACLLVVRFYYARQQQDPLLRAEEVPGVLRFEYQVNPPGDDGGLPPDAISLLRPFVIPSIG